MVPVECHRFHINVGIHQIRAAYPGACSVVQNILGAAGKMDPEIFDAILIPAGVGDFSGVDGHSLAEIGRIAAQGVTTFGHKITSLMIK